MRIISGKFKGIKLISPSSKQIRPTSDRGKETIFNVLNSIFIKRKISLSELVVLDCFCGSGSLGVESISRGAKTVYFLDSCKMALEISRKNCELINSLKSSNFLKFDFASTSKLSIKANLFFLDPPYNKFNIKSIIENLYFKGFINNKSIGVVELSKQEEEVNFEGFEIINVKKVSQSRFIFLEKK